ncbi:aldo/keto reductase [Stakelama tenebrarum]|uniref:Aldo/keto reductase n=1 Tax=Stakelama tenebrarum TaxID=2711215 RepID=A0A6G6Y892_9SPHN|nr:aldo/keto reductase [Sphingosinithalassobacter tenebrarum]QIG80793.1 aldo/keto reductase [Sphingosinithalassobacter tenebrarum]
MQYATLGNTGLIVSRLGFGALTFTQGNRTLQSVYKVGAELADQLVGRAIDAGVNFFDTADVYADGESESLLGAALKPHRDKVVLTTKVGNRGVIDRELLHGGLSRRHILWSVDQSLKRLGTDWIDCYVCHREDNFTPLEETLEALDTVVRSGKVRYIGFSNWSAWKASAAMEFQRANGLAQFTHGQMYYSLLGRDVERDHVPMMGRYDLGMTVWSPLAFGFLSGAYSRADLEKPDNRFSDFDMLGFDREQGFALLEVMRGIAERRGCTLPQLAIAWLLRRPGVTSVLIGATKAHQLDNNLGAADMVLSDEDMAELDAATAIKPIYATSQWIEPDRKTAKALRQA